MLTITHDAEIVSDIYVYAGDGIGGYEVLSNGESVSREILKFRNETHEINCAYLQMIQRSFLKAADYAGKAILILLDPNKKILQPKSKKIVSPLVRKNARFVFRFRVPNRSVLDTLRGVNTHSTNSEEKWKNLIKMMFMDIQKTKTPYWNLSVTTDFEFIQCSDSEIMELGHFVESELKLVSELQV